LPRTAKELVMRVGAPSNIVVRDPQYVLSGIDSALAAINHSMANTLFIVLFTRCFLS
jgi:hypothetical protein